jgi:hypothetical protein
MDKVEWWRVLIEQNGIKYYYTVKAPDLLSAVNIAMVSQECGVECVVKAKPRKMHSGFLKLINKFPERNLFRGVVDDE